MTTTKSKFSVQIKTGVEVSLAKILNLQIAPSA